MAISTASYSRGNPVYNGGSSAPTQGTVDPMGYIDRSLNQPSQQRSGLAQAALQRLSSSVPPNPANANGPNAPGGTSWVGSSGSGTPVTHQVTPTGQLVPGAPLPASAPPASAPNDTSNPYDAVEGAAQQRLLAGRNSYLHNEQVQRQNLEENFTNQNRAANIQHPIDLMHLLNQFSGRGMAYSSGYGYGVGQENDKFANLLAQYERSHTSGLNNLTTGENDYNANYAAQLQELRAAAVARLAGKAGDLGLGGDPGTTDPGIPVDTTPPVDTTTNTQVGPVAPGPFGVGGKGGMTPPPAMHDQLRWAGTIDPHSRAALAAGGTVKRGNGYVYKMSGPNGTGVPVRIA